MEMDPEDETCDLSGYHGYWIGSFYRMLFSVCLCESVLWSAECALVCVTLETSFLEVISGNPLPHFAEQLLSALPAQIIVCICACVHAKILACSTQCAELEPSGERGIGMCC